MFLQLQLKFTLKGLDIRLRLKQLGLQFSVLVKALLQLIVEGCDLHLGVNQMSTLTSKSSQRHWNLFLSIEDLKETRDKARKKSKQAPVWSQ